jgi:hypothetical protein
VLLDIDRVSHVFDVSHNTLDRISQQYAHVACAMQRCGPVRQALQITAVYSIELGIHSTFVQNCDMNTFKGF